MSEFKWTEKQELGSVVHECRTVEVTIEIWPRPAYCDRGRWQVYESDIRCAGFPTNPNPFDGQDGFPRYFFDLDRAKAEMEALLTFRGCTPATDDE